MESTIYFALVRRDGDSDYGVDFPALPGCTSAGHTFEEAVENAHEALAAHLDELARAGEVPPAAEPMDRIIEAAHNRDAVAFAIKIAAPRSRAVRFNATMSEDLLARIDAAASNRSRFLADAAEAELRRQARRK